MSRAAGPIVRSLVTISTRNRLAEVAVLADSLARHQPDERLTCYLVEDEARPSDAIAANLDIVGLDGLELPDRERFCFQYTPFELCCALKPFVMRHALDGGADRVVYMDGDMYVCAPFLDVLENDVHDVGLTPHAAGGAPGACHTFLLKAGAYNAGFITARATPAARAALTWWSDRLMRDCYNDYMGGVFVDQGWLPTLVALFEGVGSVRMPGLNVGHWNLEAMAWEKRGDRLLVGADEPLRVFHFSGFDRVRLTTHPTPMTRMPPLVDGLAGVYADVLARRRTELPGDAPYTFERFADGQPILPAHRELVRRGLVDVPDPFAAHDALDARLAELGEADVMSERVDYRVRTLQRDWDEAASRIESLTARIGTLVAELDSYCRRPVRTWLLQRRRRRTMDALCPPADVPRFGPVPGPAGAATAEGGLPRASIVIVTRNNETTLSRAVAACFAQRLAAGEYEIVLIDDGSDAPQLRVLDELETAYPDAIATGKFHIVRCDGRRGVGPRRNLSVREARADLLAVIDGDAFPVEDWLERVLEPFGDPAVGIVSSRVLFGADPSLANGQGCTVSLYGFGLDRFVFQPAANLPDVSEDVLYAMGCGMAMRRDVWEAVNGFDEDIVYGYEDVDFSLRAWVHGARVVTQPTAVVMHETVSFDAPTRDRIFLYMRNRWLFLIKHWPLAWILKAAVCQFGALVLTRDGRVHAPIFARAMLSLARRLPALLKARRTRAAPTLLRRLVWPHLVGPSGLYRDIRLLRRAPLTPVRRVTWSDGDTFRLGGGTLDAAGRYVELVDNGWCDVALFETSRTLALAAVPLAPGRVSVTLRFGISSTDRKEISSTHAVDAGKRLAIDIPHQATGCRMTFAAPGVPADPVVPMSIVRLNEILQS